MLCGFILSRIAIDYASCRSVAILAQIASVCRLQFMKEICVLAVQVATVAKEKFVAYLSSQADRLYHPNNLSVPDPGRARISDLAFVRCDLAPLRCCLLLWYPSFESLGHDAPRRTKRLSTPMPYGWIVMVATFGLAGVYIFGTDASLWSKALVTGLLLVSFLWRYGFFLRVALGVLLCLYFRYLKARSSNK